MNVSYRWLRELAPGLEGDAAEVAARLAALGAPADAATHIGEALGDLVVGRVLEAGKHPNADRLSVCRVDDGSGEPLSVVCGAPNVREGACYPFAPVGATLPGGVRIRKAKIRGEVSQGMLCSARELGLGHDHTGILELTGDHEPGSSFVAAAGLDDTVLDLDITADRPDLLSHRGVARALVGVDGVQIPAVPGADHAILEDPELASGEATARGGGVTVEIEDAEGCYRFLGAVIEGVTVRPSPAWLAMRLRAIGLRPINNVVDVTNYVNHELGRPMHAYDLDRVEGARIGVRRASDGERVTTLDGVERTLRDGMLVIADGTRVVGLAGVMGGEDTEVSDATTTVFLELAHFDPKAVRATRRAAGLSTDASYRFERGVDPDAAEPAMRRALAMIVALAGGRVRGEIADARTRTPVSAEISLRTARVGALLGVPYSTEDVRALLAPIGLTLVSGDEDTSVFRVPGHRHVDLVREVDLIEEVARAAGYDSFPEERRPIRPSTVPTSALSALETRLRERFAGRGFLEARTAAFAAEEDGDVALSNPLSSEESRLRRSLLPGLADRIAYNQARGARDVRLFEIGTAFAPDPDGGPLPEETTRLALAATGATRPTHWTGPSRDWDLWDASGLLEEAGRAAGHEGSRAEPLASGTAGSYRDASLGGGVIEKDASFALRSPDGELLGVAGPIRAQGAPPWSAPWVGLEILLPPAPEMGDRRTLRPISSHPASERDLALLAAAETHAGRIEQGIRDAASDLLTSTVLFDVYQGEGLPDGARSLAFRLRFQAPDRTLTDAEVDAEVERILARLREELDVHQRS